MNDLFTYGRDIVSCPQTKQSHLEKCSNGKLRTSTLVNKGTLRGQPILHQHSAILILLKYLIYLSFLSCCCFIPLLSPENHLQKVARLWKHPWERFFFDNLKKSLVEVFFPFSPASLHIWNIFEWLLSYEVTSCNY